MLFHVTMTHTTDNCPAYWSAEEQKKFFADAEEMLEAAKEKNIDIKFLVSGVGHTMYALVESDDFNSINSFFGGMPIRQDYEVEPVGDVQEVISAFKAELAHK
jgi:muconolactone delta-isomerase